MAGQRSFIPHDWVRLEQIINELFKATVPDINSDVAANASDIAVLVAELDAVSDLTVTLISDMLSVAGTIEGVGALPDPVVKGKVIRLTTNNELYIGKNI